MIYVFSEEIYAAEHGKPKGKGAWVFGDRNKNVCIVVGSMEEPLTYRKAQEVACAVLVKMGYPIYKTVYLHP